jgi:hypothetical protein
MMVAHRIQHHWATPVVGGPENSVQQARKYEARQDGKRRKRNRDSLDEHR